MTVGMWLLSHLGPDTSHLTDEPVPYMVVFGLGMGMVMQIVVLAVQNSVSHDDIGVGDVGHQLLPQHRRHGRQRDRRGRCSRPG